MYLYMYVTNTYDQVYVYIVINDSMYNLARHKNIVLMYAFMYVTNMYVTNAYIIFYVY